MKDSVSREPLILVLGKSAQGDAVEGRVFVKCKGEIEITNL